MHRARPPDGRGVRTADCRERDLAEHATLPRLGQAPPSFAGATGADAAGRQRHRQVYALAKKYKIKTAFGTDILFSPALAERQGAVLVDLTRWYTPAEALTMATSTNAELLALTGLRNPYPGKLGVVEEGALADLLLVDGNPLENIRLVADPDKNFLVIMKDGRIHKNTLEK